MSPAPEKKAPRPRKQAAAAAPQVPQGKFGIYLNTKEKKVVRINSPYWFPPAPDWVFLTAEVNETLLNIRKLAGEKKLVPTPDSIVWTSIPPKPEDLARWEAEDREKKAKEAKEAAEKAKSAKK